MVCFACRVLYRSSHVASSSQPSLYPPASFTPVMVVSNVFYIFVWLCRDVVSSLQAVTFVDTAVCKSVPSRPTGASPDNQKRRLTDGGNPLNDAKRQELPFRMAVEVSALCEMKEALQVCYICFCGSRIYVLYNKTAPEPSASRVHDNPSYTALVCSLSRG